MPHVFHGRAKYSDNTVLKTLLAISTKCVTSGQVAEHHVLKRQGMAAEEWSKEESPPPQQKKMPQPHRCNDRVEDLIQGLYTLDFSGIIRPAWKNARACFKSAEG